LVRGRLQDVNPQHPPHKQERNDRENDVANPLAWRFRSAEFEHPAILTNVCAKRRNSD